jgi:hypothetical protein
MALAKPQILGLIAVALMSSMRCRSKESAPAPMPRPAVATATATQTPEPEPAPTPTPTPDVSPRPLAELVVPTAVDLSQTPTPTPASGLSPAEERLEQDGKKLAASLDPILADADALDALFHEYATGCYVKLMEQKWQPPSGPGAAERRHWFTLLDPQPTVVWHKMWLRGPPVSLLNALDHCEEVWKEMAAKAPAVMQRIDALPDEARRAGIIPGNLRALLRKHRLVR